MVKGKAKSAAPSAAPKANQKIVNRKRRASFERKSLSKASKRLFAGSSGVVFRIIDKLERKLKEKPRKTDSATAQKGSK